MADELSTRFDHQRQEPIVYRRWEESDAFAAIPDRRENRYVVMMPLPNVTGALHMGHAMDNVMQDLLIRWHRMMGDNTLWMPGTDHAGIATQAVVEKRLLELEGKTRQDIGREGLVARIWQWKDEYQQRIVRQQQSMGCSCDWNRRRFTLDSVCARATQEAFFRLFRDGLIYRGNRLVNWDCQLQTAVSDDEIGYEKVQGFFRHIRYPVVDPQPGEPMYVTVATTRPETMLGDTAVACHPDPASELERVEQSYRERIETAPRRDRSQLDATLLQIRKRKDELLPHLLRLRSMAEDGRRVLLPLLRREIPLILDTWAKPELGSGCVKITPGHDANDYEVWKRHSGEIDIVNILNPDGTLNANAGSYEGMDRFDARRKIVEDLTREQLLEASEEREIEIGHSDRSKTPIEPYLSKQWFVRMEDVEGEIVCGKDTPKQFEAAGLAQVAIDAIDADAAFPSGRKLTFHPDHGRYGGTYRSWLAEKRDWCISRQLWWGHQIPIWHGSYAKADLAGIIAELPNMEIGQHCVWIADAEGDLHRVADIGPLPSDGPYDFLVCLRNQEAEAAYSAQLEAIGLNRDPDVLDTWFSSALWPFSTLGWPDPGSAAVDSGQRPLGALRGSQSCLSYYYPGSCLVTARDIITLWVARMLVMGLYLHGDVPFTDCFIHANIQDGKGERMSKSKGNGIDPEDIIEMYGADAMRYVLCDMQTGTQDIRLPVQAISPYTGDPVDLATAKHGRTIFTYLCPTTGKEFDVLGTMPELPTAKITSDRFEEGRAFCTKLWNAARFVLMNIGSHQHESVRLGQLEAEDRWILSRLSRTIDRVTEHLRAYNPSFAIGVARDFFWSDLCDWYLEIVKPRLKEAAQASTARIVLSTALDLVLRLLHPFVPFVTEVLWEHLNRQAPVRGLDSPLRSSELLISAGWPTPRAEWLEEDLEADFSLLQSAIGAVRELRSRYNVPPRDALGVRIKAAGRACSVLERMRDLLVHMAGIGELEIGPAVERPLTAGVQVVGTVEVYVLGLIDPDNETRRLKKQRDELVKQATRAHAKLQNEMFLSRAPAEVVDAEKRKHAEITEQLKLIDANLTALGETQSQ